MTSIQRTSRENRAQTTIWQKERAHSEHETVYHLEIRPHHREATEQLLHKTRGVLATSWQASWELLLLRVATAAAAAAAAEAHKLVRDSQSICAASLLNVTGLDDLRRAENNAVVDDLMLAFQQVDDLFPFIGSVKGACFNNCKMSTTTTTVCASDIPVTVRPTAKTLDQELCDDQLYALPDHVIEYIVTLMLIAVLLVVFAAYEG
eukprot:3183-Heterococcus_DN1.PRE.4